MIKKKLKRSESLAFFANYPASNWHGVCGGAYHFKKSVGIVRAIIG